MIKELRIRGFRSLSDVTVALDPLTVLIGRTGSGKTNFVNAVRFFRNALSYRDPNKADPDRGTPSENFVRGPWETIVTATGNRSSVEFGATFQLNGLQESFTYDVELKVSDAHRAKVARESLQFGSRMLFEHHDEKWTVEPQIHAPPKPSRLMLGLLHGVQEIKLAQLALSEGISCHDFQANVLSGGKFDASQPASLDDYAGNFLHAFHAVASNLAELHNLQEMMAGLRQVNPTVTSLEQSADRQKLYVGHQVGERGLAFDLSQESEGLRRFLAHLIALYQAPPKMTLFFEEPEKGIYPGAFSALSEFFITTAKARRSQVILTTHSPILLDHFPIDAIRVVSMEGYETKIGQVSQEQREAVRENLLTTGELLSVDPARIEPQTQPT